MATEHGSRASIRLFLLTKYHRQLKIALQSGSLQVRWFTLSIGMDVSVRACVKVVTLSAVKID